MTANRPRADEPAEDDPFSTKPSMGLAPQLVEEIFEIVKKLKRRAAGVLPAGRAEHQYRAALTPNMATSSNPAASCWTAKPRHCAKTRT